jgi:hypothetical protein
MANKILNKQELDRAIECAIKAANIGRPTLYMFEHCDTAIALGKEGKSITVLAATLEVSKDTIYEWAKVHKDFSDALTRMRALSQAWWEDAGQSAMFLPGFNASVWAKSISCRFPDDWRESTKTEHSGMVEIAAIERKIVKATDN